MAACLVIGMLSLVIVGCTQSEQSARPSPGGQPAASPGAATHGAGSGEPNADTLFTEAGEALQSGDSTAFVGCLLRLVNRPLPDSLLFRVGGLVGLGFRVVQVTNNVVADYAPRFFPDGTRLVYFSRVEREQLDYAGLRSVRYQTQICIIGIDGSNPTIISDGKASEFFPDVSFDGRYVVCQRAEGDTLKGEWTAATGSMLYVYDLQADADQSLGDTQQTAGQLPLSLGRSARRQRLGDAELYARCPRFMPRGHEVLFVTMQRALTGLLSTIDMETGEIMLRYRNPILDKLGEPYFPFLPSPFADGAHIVFQTGLWEEKAIFVSDSVGQEIVRLTPEGLSERHPSPAPDNRTVIFVSDAFSGEELFLRRLDDTIRHQLTFDGYDKAFPAYSPDGRYVAFGAKPRAYAEADYEIYLLDLGRPVPRAEVVARIRDLAHKLGIAGEHGK